MNSETSERVRLRDGRMEDAEAIEAVHYASREAVYSKKVADWPPIGPGRVGRIELWKEWLADPDIMSLIAEVSGDIVGFCTIRTTGDADEDSAIVAEMPTLYVHPDHWRHGHGRTLCEEAVRRGRNAGFQTLTLWVLEINTYACHFYSTFGFSLDTASKTVESTSEELVALRYRLQL